MGVAERVSRTRIYLLASNFTVNLEHMSICDSLQKRQENDSFFKRMMTDDEKWIVYNNVVRKRSYGHSSEPPQTI